MGGEVSTGRKVIAAFDFDGTITRRDSLPVFIWYAVRLYRILQGSLIITPFIALYKMKFIPNYQAKERLFKAFFAGVKIHRFEQLCSKFSSKIDLLVNPDALSKIKWHQKMGHEVIIISASAENWIKPWAARQGISVVLATKLEVKNHRITGKFLSNNCHGKEKVNRLLEEFPEREKYILYAYGDSNGDKELLNLADYSFYRRF